MPAPPAHRAGTVSGSRDQLAQPAQPAPSALSTPLPLLVLTPHSHSGVQALQQLHRGDALDAPAQLSDLAVGQLRGDGGRTVVQHRRGRLPGRGSSSTWIDHAAQVAGSDS